MFFSFINFYWHFVCHSKKVYKLFSSIGTFIIALLWCFIYDNWSQKYHKADHVALRNRNKGILYVKYSAKATVSSQLLTAEPFSIFALFTIRSTYLCICLVSNMCEELVNILYEYRILFLRISWKKTKRKVKFEDV